MKRFIKYMIIFSVSSIVLFFSLKINPYFHIGDDRENNALADEYAAVVLEFAEQRETYHLIVSDVRNVQDLFSQYSKEIDECREDWKFRLTFTTQINGIGSDHITIPVGAITDVVLVSEKCVCISGKFYQSQDTDNLFDTLLYRFNLQDGEIYSSFTNMEESGCC